MIKYFSFLLPVFLLFPAVSWANSLINNSANGVVTGSVVQGDGSAVEVGSISYQYQDVQNVSVAATVKGDIVTGSGASVRVGSYHGK